MPTTLSKLLAEISKKKVPPMILVGGNNEFLVEHAFASIRDAILEAMPGVGIESYDAGTDLSSIIDSYRTFSLFAKPRLLVVPDVNAFISREELVTTYEKALDEWSKGKTDRKRDSALAKLLHALGLAGLDTDMTDAQIAKGLGVEVSQALSDMLGMAKLRGKRATKGESDAALLAEAAVHGGAPSSTLLMRTGKLPAKSATIDSIDAAGTVLPCDVTREMVPTILRKMVKQVEEEAHVTFDPAAVDLLTRRLGVDRILDDKYSTEIPDLRNFITEAERLATYAGTGATVTRQNVEQLVSEVAGGARFEFSSLVSEGKPVEAIAKLRDLVAQARREDPSVPAEIVYGRFIFPLASAVRQMLAIQSFARARGLDAKRSVPYGMFKDSLSDELGGWLKENGLVDKRPHPFALHKTFEAARRYAEDDLLAVLEDLGNLEISRKSGGTPAELGLELAVLRLVK